MRRVAHNVVAMLVNAADRTGTSLEELTRGTPVTEPQLRALFSKLDWDLFVELLERLEGRVGYARLEAICSYVPDIATGDRSFLGAFASPRMLYRFVNGLAGPSMYPMFQSVHEELPDGSFRLVITLRDGCRPCHTFFRLMVPANAAVPCFLGLPASEVVAHTHERGLDMQIFPPDPAGGRRSARGHPPEDVADWIASASEDKRRLLEANEALWRARDSTLHTKLARARFLWALTDRQTQVLSGLARGRTNKELGSELGCSAKTIEHHVTELLSRSGRDSRLALVAHFWAEI